MITKEIYKISTMSRISLIIIIQIRQQSLSTVRTKVLIIFREINFFRLLFSKINILKMNDLLFAIKNIIIIELKLNYKIIFLITFLNFIIKKINHK